MVSPSGIVLPSPDRRVCSSSSVDGVCGERVAHNNVITMVTKKKPPAGSTKVKFIFKKPETANGADYVYR